ncbi:relaxin receptor 2 [Trichonephila clavipes]|nr:relaxin receptor 2 [Trichonephila clavipes]
MRARNYCAHHNTRDHWTLRCMNRYPDLVVCLNRDLQRLRTRSKLGTHLSTQCSGDERQSRPCAARVEIQKDLYAWVAVFLLPVNSALNPVLYTLTTKLFKQHLAKIVYSCRAPAHAANDTSGISLTSILHHRNSKKTLVTTFSEKDHNSSNRTSLLVPDSPASIRAANCTHKRKDFPSYLKEDMI